MRPSLWNETTSPGILDEKTNKGITLQAKYYLHSFYDGCYRHEQHNAYNYVTIRG